MITKPQKSAILQHLSMLECTSEATPGNAALVADYRLMLDELESQGQELAEQEREKLGLTREVKGYQLAIDCYLKNPKAIEPMEFIAQLLDVMQENDAPAPTLVAAEPPQQWYPGEAEKELKDISARLLRAESVLEQTGVIIGRYEVTGLPLYGDDDYVEDAEGCYLTRAEANELLEDEQNTASASPLVVEETQAGPAEDAEHFRQQFSGEAAPTYEELVAAAKKSGMPNTLSRDTWEQYSRAGRRRLVELAQQWTQPVDAQGKPLEFKKEGHWNE